MFYDKFGNNIFNSIQNQKDFWNFLNQNIGGFIYFADLPLNPDKSVNITLFNEWQGDSGSLYHTSWDMINVGPMRLTQYRTKTL